MRSLSPETSAIMNMAYRMRFSFAWLNRQPTCGREPCTGTQTPDPRRTCAGQEV